MRSPILLRAGMISPLALALAACNAIPSPPPLPPAGGSSRPAIAIPLTDHDGASQARLAGELAAAPADAEWPRYIAGYSTTRRAVCAVTPAQPACRRICAAEGNRPAFCARAAAN